MVMNDESESARSHARTNIARGVLPEEVVIKEVDVETGLDEAADVHDPVVLVVHLVVGAVHPVDDVECAVDAEKEYIMRGQVFDFSVSLKDDQLRDDGNGFQVDGEHPKQLQRKQRLVNPHPRSSCD
jgi:hypothetical protein